MDATAETLVVERPRTTAIAIFTSVILLAAGFALQGTALVLRAGIEGFGEITIGTISAAYFVGMFAGSFVAMRVIREVGHVRTFAGFASILSTTAIVHILWINPIAWIVFRFATGLCVSIVFVVVESWLNAITPNDRRGRMLSFYGILYLAATGASQPLIGVFSPTTFELFAVTSILMSLCLVPVSLARVSGTPSIDKTRIRLTALLRNSPLGTAGVLTSGFVMGTHMSLGARFGQLRGMSDGAIGVFLLTVSLGTMVFQLPLGLISDRWDRRSSLMVAGAAGSVAALLLAVAQPGTTLLVLAAFLFGGFAVPIYSLSLATINDQVAYDELVEASSTIYVLYAIGSISGPIVASLAVTRIGAPAIYVLSAIVLAGFLVATTLRVRSVPEYRIQGRPGRYRVFPRTTAIVYSLLRRGQRGPSDVTDIAPASGPVADDVTGAKRDIS